VFLPEKVSVWLWQLGQRKHKLSILLSVETPFLCSNCNVIVLPFQLPTLSQITHLYSITPSLTNLSEFVLVQLLSLTHH
jgi:hypothetical protein